jgi:peptidoglycan/LPS O-acetylase OafA/YrhL
MMRANTPTSHFQSTAEAALEVPRPPGARMVYLDRLRIGLVVLVVLHHVAMAYGAGGLGFYYVDPPETFFSRNLLVFVLHNQAWFMGAFFLVAGYFTPGSLDRRGTAGFLKSRSIRLGIPLVIYSAVLNPIAMTGWFHVPDELGPLTWATFDYVDHVRMGPTWFLALLLIFSSAYAVWRSLVGSRTAGRPPASGPGVVGIAAFVLLLAGVQFFLRMQVAIGESWAGFPSLAYLAQYVAFFVIGTVAYRRRWLQSLRTSTGLIGLGAAAGVTLLLFPLAFSGEWFSIELTEAVNRAMGDGNWQSAVYSLWDATLAVGLCLGLLVLLRGAGHRDGALGRFLARHSYGVYVVHIPIVVYTAVLVSDTGLAHTGRLLLTAAVAVPLSFALAAVVRWLPRASRVL